MGHHRLADLEPGDPGPPPGDAAAGLVAEGMSNRDVADVLFVSVKTVETNLTRVYRKLGIRSRTQLGKRLASGSTAESATPG